jgi:opacity protein-like surface antigen
VKATRFLILCAAILLASAASARAEGFITPFVGYNFGGDSGNCATLTNCSTKRTNYGVSIGAMGPLFGIEEDLSFAQHFFGDSPNTDNSVFSAMTNLLVGIGVGPVQPYALAGVGLIRPHVSSPGFSADNNAFGWDLGGGVTVSVAPHVGIRGDIRHFHTVQDVNLSFFTGQRLDFFRASLGVALKF